MLIISKADLSYDRGVIISREDFFAGKQKELCVSCIVTISPPPPPLSAADTHQPLQHRAGQMQRQIPPPLPTQTLLSEP
jgi:hypothetical protein